ncbi:hypothetical protein C8F01DRAFT_956965, partial [Mycena amicta]
LGDDDADGVARNQPVDEYDEIFGNGGEMMDIDLPEDVAVSAREATAMAKMNAELDALSIRQCAGCREESFDLKLKTATFCGRCADDMGDVRKWSAENNTNPSAFSSHFVSYTEQKSGPMPPELSALTELEEMLIARIKTVMQVRYTKG